MELFNLFSKLFNLFFLIFSKITQTDIFLVEICTQLLKLAPAKVVELPAWPGVPVQAGHHAALGVGADLHKVLLSAVGLVLAES